MYYGGIDAHRSYLTVAVVDGGGELLREEGRVPIGDGEPLLESLEGFEPLEVVVERCPFWPWIHDVLEPTEIGFHLAHASRLEAIAQAEKKTDSIDARLLAHMLATNLIPEVYPKPADQRELVQLVRHRAALVEQRTALANRIHSHLLLVAVRPRSGRASRGWGILVRNSPCRVGHAGENAWIKLAGNDMRPALSFLEAKQIRYPLFPR